MAPVTVFVKTILLMSIEIFYFMNHTCYFQIKYYSLSLRCQKCWYLINIHKLCELRSPKDKCFFQTESDTLHQDIQKH